MNKVSDSKPAVITLDGPAAVGKGTVAQLLAAKLGFYYLDSGKLYRAVAWEVLQAGLSLDAGGHSQNEKAIGKCAVAWAQQWQEEREVDSDNLINSNNSQHFQNPNNPNVWAAAMQADENLSLPNVGEAASLVAKIALVRQALLPVQRAFRQLPGLVADGRDMGSVVFADAVMKVYLDAPVEIRAKRRVAQLQNAGICAKISEVLAGLKVRDARDSGRDSSPLAIPSGSLVVDSSSDSAAIIADKLALEFTQHQS